MLMNSSGRVQTIGAAFMVVAMALVVGSALAFEHIGGYVPCALCLQQREPYYIGLIVGLIALASAYWRWPGCIARGGLAIIGLLMVYGLVLSVYHAGVEWAWWAGPADCATTSTTGITTDANDLLGALDTIKPPSCDEAAGRFLGLSFAGWNVLASVALAFAAFKAAVAK